MEVYLRSGLSEGSELEQKKLYELVDESEKILAKEYLLTYLSSYSKSAEDAKRKLYDKGYHKNAVEYALAVAKEYNYLNDTSFAERYVDAAIRKKGRRAIAFELKRKGIDDALIEDALVDTEDEEVATATKFALKFKNKTNYTKDKLYRHLLSKGFSYEVIRKAMRACEEDIDFD